MLSLPGLSKLRSSTKRQLERRLRNQRFSTITKPMAIARFLGAITSASLCIAQLSSTAFAEEKSQEEELQSYIQIAKTNPLAQRARAKTNAARAQEEEVAGHRWARLDVTSFLAPSPKIRCENIDCTQTSPKDVTINVAGLFAGIDVRLTQPLYTGGKLHYLKQAAKAATLAHKALESDVAGDIASKTAKAYYSYLLAQELLWMLEDGAEQIEGGRKTLEEKLAEGDEGATVQDRFRIQTLQSEVQAQIADARLAQIVALASLRALLGDKTLQPEDRFLEPAVFQIDTKNSEFHQGLTVNDPQVKAAQFGLQAQRALQGYESRKFIPDLALVGGVNFARAQGVDDPPGAFARDPFNTSSAYVAVTAKWQITPLAQRARVKRQRAVKRQAHATLKAAKALASLEAQTAFAKAKQAKIRMAALEGGARAGKAWVASVLQADAIGGASTKDLADAYLAYFSARSHVLQSVYQWNLAVFELRRRSGEFAATP